MNYKMVKSKLEPLELHKGIRTCPFTGKRTSGGIPRKPQVWGGLGEEGSEDNSLC